MDPLSMSASISGLISILGVMVEKSYKYINTVRGYAQDVKQLVDHMTDLYGILNKLRLVASRFDDESITSTIQLQHINSCRTLLEKIKERLDKADPQNIDNQKSEIIQKASAIRRALVWPFKASETKSLIADVDSLKSTLTLALQVDGINALLDALGDRKAQGLEIGEIRANVLALRNEKVLSVLSKKQKKIIEWISPYDPTQRHQNIAAKLRHPNTGQCVFDQLRTGDGMAYFYCDYKDPKTQDPLNIIGSLVKQLALADNRGFAKLETAWDDYCSRRDMALSKAVSTEQLCSLLRDISHYFDNVHLIIDALDECGHGRSRIVELLTELSAGDNSNIKIILTSRPEPDIERHLSEFIKVSIEANRSDLELYVHSEMEVRLRDERLIIRDQKLKEEITQRLVNEAQGMCKSFRIDCVKKNVNVLVRWVTCQLDHLCKLNTDRDIRQALNKELVRRVLVWIVCSIVPLSTQQLLEAVAINVGDKKLDKDGIPSETRILERCSSLVRKTGSPENTRIELAHFTVKEFLFLRRENSPYTAYHISQDRLNPHLAKLCLTYLLFNDFRGTGPCTTKEERVMKDEKYPFYRYAALNFPRHACDFYQDEGLWQLLQKLFDASKTSNFLSWAQEILLPEYEIATSKNIISKASTLHFAVLLSLRRVTEWLILDPALLSYLNNSTGIGTPLTCALGIDSIAESLMKEVRCTRHSHISDKEEILKYLLQAGVEVDKQLIFETSIKGDKRNTTSRYVTALEIAILDHFGWEVLLQHGATVTDWCLDLLEDRNWDSGFVESFIEKTQTKNVPTHMNSRFLKFAKSHANRNEHLLNEFFHSIEDISSVDERAAFHTAASFGQANTILQLLQKGRLDINYVSKGDGMTALHCASMNGHLGVVKILLDHHASIDLVTSSDKITRIAFDDKLFDLKSGTAFHLAVRFGHLDIAKLLELNGADINKSDKFGMTPLHSATAQSVNMIEFLLQSSGQHHSFTAKTHWGWTVLMAAAKFGSIDMFKFVLQNSDPSIVLSQDHYGFNCLHEAILSGYDGRRKVALLRRSCIDPYTPINKGFTPLHLAAERDFDTFSETLDFTLKEFSKDSRSPSALKVITHHSYLQSCDARWSILDNAQHPINFITKSGESTLQRVIDDRKSFTHQKLRMLRLLLSTRKVNLEFRDNKGRSALIRLCNMWLHLSSNKVSHQHFLASAIIMLLRCGAFATQEDQAGDTALHYLCRIQMFTELEYRCISYLLVDSYDDDYDDDDDDVFMTALESSKHRLASRNDGYLEIIQDQPFAIKIALRLLSAASIKQLNNTLIDGRHLLHITIACKQDQLSHALLDLGVDTISPDEGKPPRTALEMLCIHGSKDKKLIHTIVQGHKDKTILNADGSTMLHLACKHKQMAVLEALLIAGWRVESLDKPDQLPPIINAIKTGNQHIVNILLKYGATLKNVYPSPYPALDRHIPTLSIAPNVEMCRFLESQGINNWKMKITIPFKLWGVFIPGLSSIALHNTTALHWVAGFGTKETMEYALNSTSGLDIDSTTSFGCTPLFFAVYAGNPDNCKCLLSHGANVNETYGSYKWTPLHLSAARGDVEIVEILLEFGAAIHARNTGAFTPAMIALERNHEHIAQWLKTLEFSAETSKVSHVSSQVKAVVPIIKPVQEKTYIEAAIEDCITYSDLPSLKLLLEDGYSLGGCCRCGCSPLLKAFVEDSSKEVINYLLDIGASLEGVETCTPPLITSGFTPLHQAALLGDEKIMKRILTLGKPTSSQKVYPLHIAAYNGHSACVRIILSHDLEGKCGVDVKSSRTEPRCHEEAQMVEDEEFDTVEDIGGTALHYASWRGHIDVITELLRFGADLEARDKFGETSLHLAAESGHLQVCQLLVLAGANMMSRNFENLCPINYAIERNHQKIVEDMIKRGDFLDILDNNGSDLLDYACRFGNAEIVDMLIAAGMNINSVDDFGWSKMSSAIGGSDLTDGFLLKLLPEANILQEHSIFRNLLTDACFYGRSLISTELLKRVPKEQIPTYVNYVGSTDTPLYSAAISRKESPELMELLIDYGAELEISNSSHGTPLMGACYFGRYDTVALLLKKGAKTTCKKSDGTELTAVGEAKHHPEILTLLQNFEERGMEAFDEPRPILVANMTKVEECMKRIAEEEEKEEKEEKEKEEKERKEEEGEGEEEEEKKKEREKIDEGEAWERNGLETIQE
ncbi:hypothetical protein NHQ30_002708 [Ciborinia camelliae]|nr:hypothetical protein NHQ30_002708 [Ciborinia camelliae]